MKQFLIFVLALFMVSCFEQGDCSDVSSNVMQANFYNYSNKKAIGIRLDSIKMIGWDTVLYATDSLSKVALPLDPKTKSMTYIFYFENTQASLEIKYNFQTYALAPDCNAIDLITLKDATGITIQDLTISQPKLTNTIAENIKLYF